MATCSNCGARIEGRFCPKCGAAAAGAQPAGGGQQAAGAQPAGRPEAPEGKISDKVAAGLCYFAWPSLFLWLLMEPYKRRPYVRFHAFQALFLLGAMIVVLLPLGVAFGLVQEATGMSAELADAILGALQLPIMVLGFYLLVATLGGKKVVLPVIGRWAERRAHV